MTQPYARDPKVPAEETTWQATWNWIIRPLLWIFGGVTVLALIDGYGWGVILLPVALVATTIGEIIDKIAPTELGRAGLALTILVAVLFHSLSKQIERLSDKVDRVGRIAQELRDRR